MPFTISAQKKQFKKALILSRIKEALFLCIAFTMSLKIKDDMHTSHMRLNGHTYIASRKAHYDIALLSETLKYEPIRLGIDVRHTQMTDLLSGANFDVIRQ